MVARSFNGGPDKLDLIQILISEIKLQFYILLPIAFLSRSYPKIYHPLPQPLAVFFFSQHTPTPNRRYHTREIDVKPDKTKCPLFQGSIRKAGFLDPCYSEEQSNDRVNHFLRLQLLHLVFGPVFYNKPFF